MKKLFLNILRKNNLYDEFIAIYENDMSAENTHGDGWFFDNTYKLISYRITDLFGTHSDGNNWYFGEESVFDSKLKEVLLNNSFTIKYEGGDGGDACILFEYKK